MRNQLRLRNLLVLLTFTFCFYSCQDDDVTLEIPKDNQTSLSEDFAKVEQFLTLKNNLNQLKATQSSVSRFGLNIPFESPSNGRVSECTEGNGNYLAESINTSSFSKLQVQAGVNAVRVSEGETQSVIVTVDSNILEELEISASNNTLVVTGKENSCLLNYRLDIEIVVPNLEEVNFLGSGVINIGDFANTEKLTINNSGSGIIEVSEYSKATSLDIQNRGSGHITMYESFPSLKSYQVTSQGSGDYYGCVLNVEECIVKNMGSGYVGVSATSNLSIELLGSGTVEYFGTPNSVNESNLGSGIIKASESSECSVPDWLPRDDDEIGRIPGGFWTGCAEITEVENPDGSFTVTVDYGEGCEEVDEYFKIFMFGKYTEISRFFDETPELSIGGGVLNQGRFEGVTVYENFGSEIDGWRSTMNGESQYANSFEHFFSESEGAFKIIDKNSYQDALTIETSSEDFSEMANVISNYEEVYEETEGSEPTITVNKADYEYVSAESSFSSKVVEPLVLKFECEEQDDDIFIEIYVSGIEEITYDDETFTIDYGNGACDNLVTITDSEGNTITYNMATGEIEGE